MDVFAEATADQFTEEVKHLTIGGQNKRSTRISNTPEFAMILAKGLYSNGLRAMVREVICNGWDPHIETGRTHIPLEITFAPDKFVVKDHGPGIPDEDIAEIYGVFGESTKRKQTNTTGGFGLGSKAPFAVEGVVSFFVTSSYGGTTTGYVVTKEDPDTDYLPSITTLFQIPTVPEGYTGVTVEVPLTGIPTSTLQDHINAVLIGGEIPAKVWYMGVCANAYDIPHEERLGLKDSEVGVCLYNVEKYGPLLSPKHHMMAQLGNVIYPIPSNYVPRSVLSLLHNLSVNKMAMVIKLPSGSCRMAPSREELIWNDQTEAVIKETCANFMQAYEKIRLGERHEQIKLALQAKDKDRPQLAEINSLNDLKEVLAYLKVERIHEDIPQANILRDIKVVLERGTLTPVEKRMQYNLIHDMIWAKLQHLEPVKRSIFLKYFRILTKKNKHRPSYTSCLDGIQEYSHKVFQRLYKGNFTLTRAYPYIRSADFKSWTEPKPDRPIMLKDDRPLNHVIVYTSKPEGKHIVDQTAWSHKTGSLCEHIYAFRWVKMPNRDQKVTIPGTTRDDMIQALETVGALVTDLTELSLVPARKPPTGPRATGIRTGYPIYYDCSVEGEDRLKARRCNKPQAYITLSYLDAYLRNHRDILKQFLPDLVLITSDAGLKKAEAAGIPSVRNWIARQVSKQADDPVLVKQLRIFSALGFDDQELLGMYSPLIQGTDLKKTIGRVLDVTHYGLWQIFYYLGMEYRNQEIKNAVIKIQTLHLDVTNIKKVRTGLEAIRYAARVFQPGYLLNFDNQKMEIQKTISGFLGLILKNNKG